MGPTRAATLRSMAFSTPAWVGEAIFYQVFPDRFARSGRVSPPGPLEEWGTPPTGTGFKGGDLYGIVQHLDHLERLGVNALYLNPVFASASNHRYHIYDYHTVDPLLGGEQALRALIDAAHARGMRVILDGVFNHASRGFWPFSHVMEVGRDSPYRDWFYLNPEFLEQGRQLVAYPLTETEKADPSDPGWHTRDGSLSLRQFGYRAWRDLPALPKLNVQNPEVREFLLGVAEHWIRFGADGWRLDVPEEIEDPDFWREFRQRVKAVNPEAYIVAEIWELRPEVLAGDRFDALMNYPLGVAVLSFAGGGHLDTAMAATHATVAAGLHPDDGPGFVRRLEDIVPAYGPSTLASQLNLLGSHDTPRILSLCGGDVDSVRLAMLIVMTLPGAPCIYYGDEIGLAGGMDPDCRGAFPWQDEEAWDRGLLEYVSALGQFRRTSPALRSGDLDILAASGSTVAYLRALPGECVVVAHNNGAAPAVLEVPLPEDLPGPLRAVPLPGALPAEPEVEVRSGRAAIAIPARSGRILRG